LKFPERFCGIHYFQPAHSPPSSRWPAWPKAAMPPSKGP
jgi:hypothetical protein